MWFHVLGPVGARRDGVDLDIGPPQQRAVLAALIAAASKPVSSSTLSDVLWAGAPPSGPLTVIQQYISRLRRILDPRDAAAREPAAAIRRDSGGYQLIADESNVDVLQWRVLVARARKKAGEGNAQAAGDVFLDAFKLWSGPVASDLPSEVRAHPIFTALQHEHVAVLSEAANLAIAAGGAETLIEALDMASAWHPFDEGLHAHVLRALTAAGRRVEALNRFQKIRERLVRELGIEPGPLLQQAHQWVLDPKREPARAVDTAVPPPASPVAGAKHSLPQPAQLPLDLPVFVGRSAELAAVHSQMLSSPLIFIGGMAGVGKTSLALHIAHQVAGQYPDGQLYANLRGFDPGNSAARPSEVLRSFLEALGVAIGMIPQELDAQAALFRSKLAGRQLLLVLDNARDANQVLPLLPGTPTSKVIITSRDHLTRLVVSQGARPVVLSALPDSESRLLLSGRLGDERLLAEPMVVEEILAVCAGLPIGLTIVAAHAAAHPDLPLSDISAGLRDVLSRLDTLSTGDSHSDIRAIFSWSVRNLAPEPARLFRLLGLHLAPNISLNAAASLMGTTPRRVRVLFTELIGAALVAKQPGDRYEMHDLLLAYAAEIAEETDPEQARRQAIDRILDYYGQTAYAAARLMNPQRKGPEPDPPMDEVTLPELHSRTDAVDWFSGEYRALQRAVALAEVSGFDARVLQLGWSLVDFELLGGYWLEQIDVQAATIRAARRLGDRASEAVAYRIRAQAFMRMSRAEEALDHLNISLRLFGQLDDAEGQGYAHLAIGEVYDMRHLHEESLSHAERAVAFFERSGNKRSLANALGSAGWGHAQLGDYERARDMCQQSLAVYEMLDNPGGQAANWHSIGFVHQKLGQLEEAIECFSRSIEFSRVWGDPYGEAIALTHQGDAFAAVKEHQKARQVWQQALGILEALDHKDAEGVRERLTSAPV